MSDLFFAPLQTRMNKAFPKTRSVQQKSPFFLSAFSLPVSGVFEYRLQVEELKG